MQPTSESANKEWINFTIFWQVAMIIIFFVGLTYSDADASVYSTFQDIHVMMFIGFGFLMTYLKKYSFSSLGFNFVLAALTLQWALIMNGFWARSHSTDYTGKWGDKIHIDILGLVNADFTVAAILISFGAVLGKANLFQLTVMAFIEVIFYTLNLMFLSCGGYLCIADIGGSVVIHTFGAYFGLAVSLMMGGGEAVASADCSSNKVSDLFSMLGTIFLWMFWSSFNSASALSETEQLRTIVNTIISICASCLTTFVMSAYLSPGYKFQMVHIQNATLAGGVGIGAVSNMMVYPGGAMLIGSFAGCLSTFGFKTISPYLEKVFGLHDTCGVHNLHGMPGILSGLISVLVAGVSLKDKYFESSYDEVFSAVGRTYGEQAGYQFLCIVVTLGIAILSGTFTGLLIRQPYFKTPTIMFDDKVFWDYESAMEHGHIANVPTEEK